MVAKRYLCRCGGLPHSEAVPYPRVFYSSLRLWDLQIATDLSREELVQLAVTRDGGCLPGRPIHVNGVVSALAQQHTTMQLKVSDEIDSLHALKRSGSRMTSAPTSSSSTSCRLASSTSKTASRRFARASSRVAP